MDDDLAPPVKSISNAFHRGVVLAQRICKTARNQSEAHQLDVLYPAAGLERSLAISQGRVKDAYALSAKMLGKRFSQGIDNDPVVTNRLQALTINLLEHINSLDDYMDDPMAFDVGSFPYLQRESERCCEQTLITLGGLHQSLAKASPGGSDINSSPLGGVRRVSSERRSSIQMSPTADSFTNSVNAPVQNRTPVERTTHLSSANPEEVPASAEIPLVSNSVEQKGVMHWTSPNDIPEDGSTSTWHDPPILLFEATKTTDEQKKISEPEPHLIKTDEVLRQMAINDEILEKRKQSKMVFLQELRRLSDVSASTIASTATSPIESIVTFAGTPSTTSRSNSSVFGAKLPNRESQSPRLRNSDLLEGHDSARYSYSSSLYSTRSRTDTTVITSGAPESPLSIATARPDGLSENIRGLFSMRGDTLYRNNSGSGILASPPKFLQDDRNRNVLSTSRDLGSRDGALAPTVEEDWRSLGTSARSTVHDSANPLRLPALGSGIEDGKEAVVWGDEKEAAQDVQHVDQEKMLASESKVVPTPALSVQSLDHQIKHDSSFYKYGGFCEGAKMVIRGVNGAMKLVKKPGGHYTALKSMKCISCDYEIGFHLYERDQMLDRTGIYSPKGNTDIRFRQQLLLKSHIHSKLEEPSYACVFCIEDGNTLEDYDATVFFSAAQYFAHIAKHPRPLRPVPGFTVLYGSHPEILDFDLCFIGMKHHPPTFGDISSKISTRPSAHAIVNHRKGAKGFHEHDPEHNPTLNFAIGAKIVGITYPPRFHGNWACGYHDSEKSYFPASCIALDPPAKDNVTINPKSGLTATAVWDHKRDLNSGWLSFSKKDRISCIDFPFEGFWCWSGVNQKGVWGVFPAAFVTGLADTDAQGGAMGPGGWINPAGFNPDTAFAGLESSGEGSIKKRGNKMFGRSSKSVSGSTGGKEKDKESGWGSRLGRSGTSAFSGIGRKSGAASIMSGTSDKS